MIANGMSSHYQQHGMAPRQQQTHVGGLYNQSSSIYSRTLEELQDVIGEPGAMQNVGSMNMDDFLRSIWSAEENQTMAAAMAAGADQQQIGLFSQASAQKQLSLQQSLPRQISRKTVDEVWRDISVMIPTNTANNERQMTLGEMTLEDFLIKAGVEMPSKGGGSLGTQFGHHNMPSAPPPPPHHPAHQSRSTHLGLGPQMGDPTANNTQVATQATLAAIQNAANQQQAEWLKYQMTTASAAAALANQNQQQMAVAAAQATAGQQQQQQQQQQMFHQAAMASQQAAHSAQPYASAHPHPHPHSHHPPSRPAATALAISAPPPPKPHPPPPEDYSSDSQGDEGTPRENRKRGNGEVGGEKVVERRQKRMIKNRESAARSRARKQGMEAEMRQQQLIQTLTKTVKEAQAAAEGSRKEGVRRTRSGPW